MTAKLVPWLSVVVNSLQGYVVPASDKKRAQGRRKSAPTDRNGKPGINAEAPNPPRSAPGYTPEQIAQLDAEAQERGAQKSVAAILGEIVWLMTQSPKHKHYQLADLEWLVMPPVLLRQFKLYYDPHSTPVAVDLIAKVDEATAARLDAGVPTMRPQDWASGLKERLVERISLQSPEGGQSPKQLHVMKKI
ncbi:toxin-activating lysine-acyltransferase [Phreatobacter stygius]|uniref:RTX toxin-activating lysine-acyltransferase n=1 Tax=Phreatobacter stygius TaxID=1940610 RepID=A0A4D7B230_9HYPH|nr:toxin-activating lysine-acyltransferase [Phreatobacter stygius]QCI63586.1 toxin-activating lysine-acyltransferase [Phreatobacter stygius]